MNIGDKVRFLHEVGGGVISGFQDKHTVLVQDEDGFDIPMPITEVVVVNTDAYNLPKEQKKTSGAKTNAAKQGMTSQAGEEITGTSLKAQLSASLDREEDEGWEPCERPVTFKAAPVERKGGDVLNLTLAFVPADAKSISTTEFDTYILNDSNYHVQLLYLHAEGQRWNLLYQGVVAPWGRVCVDNFDHSVLGSMEELCLQAMAWKDNKPFEIKPALSTRLKLDCTKFYKLHTFHASEHFERPCWEVPAIREDNPVRPLQVDAERLQEALSSPSQPTPVPPAKAVRSQEAKAPKSAPRQGEVIEVDLHIAALLDTAAGMSPADILLVQMKEFRRVMDENIRRPGQRIVFIHGKGDGVLRRNLLQELKYRYKQCSWQDASFREYGYGATQVTVHNAPKS